MKCKQVRCLASPIIQTTLWRCVKPMKLALISPRLRANLHFVMSQLAQLPTRAYLCRMLLVSTASLWALLGAVALWLR